MELVHFVHLNYQLPRLTLKKMYLSLKCWAYFCSRQHFTASSCSFMSRHFTDIFPIASACNFEKRGTSLVAAAAATPDLNTAVLVNLGGCAWAKGQCAYHQGPNQEAANGSAQSTRNVHFFSLERRNSTPPPAFSRPLRPNPQRGDKRAMYCRPVSLSVWSPFALELGDWCLVPADSRLQTRFRPRAAGGVRLRRRRGGVRGWARSGPAWRDPLREGEARVGGRRGAASDRGGARPRAPSRRAASAQRPREGRALRLRAAGDVRPRRRRGGVRGWARSGPA